jgi:hypothetical protein
MADRQDIDALIVGALYGELDVADRARLEAHLTSHPEDRAALDALERTRTQIRRGLAEYPDAEPAPKISALLLKEAARLVPEPSRPVAAAAEPARLRDEPEEGLWARFIGWLRPIALHPALAGAAALVLVAGTATALWVRGKGEVAEPTVERISARDEAPKSEPRLGDPPPPPAEENRLAAATATGEREAKEEQAGQVADEFSVDIAPTAPADTAPPSATKPEPAHEKRAAPAERKRDRKSGAPGYVEVDIAEDDGADIKREESGKDKNVTATAKDARRDAEPEETKAKEKAPVADADDATNAQKKVAREGSGDGAGATQPDRKPDDPKVEEWAKTQHSRLLKLVADGKCPEAGRVGAAIKDRAPEYYASNVANDRRVRACKSYIEKQSKKRAGKNYKSRAQGGADMEDAVNQ